MNNIYFDKYEKYKLKYLKLKKEYIAEGGMWSFDSKRKIELKSLLKQQESVTNDLYNNLKIIINNYNKISQQKKEANIQKEKAYELVNMLQKEVSEKTNIIDLIDLKKRVENFQLEKEIVTKEIQTLEYSQLVNKIATEEVMLLEELAVLEKAIEEAKKTEINKAQIFKEILKSEHERVFLKYLKAEAEAKRERERERENEGKDIQTLEQLHKQIVLLKILKRIQIIKHEQEKNTQQIYENKLKNNTEIEKILQIQLDQYKEENSRNKDKLALAQEQYLIEQNKYIELDEEFVLINEQYSVIYKQYREALRLQNLTEEKIKKLYY